MEKQQVRQKTQTNRIQLSFYCEDKVYLAIKKYKELTRWSYSLILKDALIEHFKNKSDQYPEVVKLLD